MTSHRKRIMTTTALVSAVSITTWTLPPVSPGLHPASAQAQQAAVADAVDPTGTAAVAERLARMAQMSLSGKELTDDHWRQASALLKAACRLNPAEPRFSKLLLDASLQLDDTEAAVAALEMYLKVRPGDQLAKLQLIDLYLTQMETAEKRLEYLTGQLVENTALAKELRSAAATRAARLYLDRDQRAQSYAMLDQALALEPLNPEACAMQYARLSSEGAPPAQRVAALLAMLRANPAQPSAMTLLGDELADVGLHELSQQWYARGFDLAQRLGQPIDPASYLSSAAGALVLGQSKTAEARASGLLAMDPTNYDAQLLRLLAIRRVGTEDQLKQAIEATTGVLVERANVVHRARTGQDAPSTQPAGELFQRIPDPATEVAAIKQADNPQLAEAYADTLSSLAMLQIVLAKNPGDGQRLLDAVKQLVPDDSVVSARLEGWLLLTTGKTDEARAKLQAVADRDPLSRLGLIRLDADAGEQAAAQEQARQLLGAHPSGLLGAILSTMLADLEVRGEPSPASVDVRAELAKFPMDWLDILDRPAGFYTLSAEAPRVSHGFGEPILATVTIKNTSRHDITMGPSGTLRPDLWFDCAMRGVTNQTVPGVAFDRMGGKLVLRRNDSVTHVVRVDQGQLWQMMQGNPSTGFPLFFSVFTNPAPAATVAAPGPAGYRSEFRRPVERAATPIFQPQERNAVFNALALGTAGEKVRMQEMLAQYTTLLAQQQQQDFGESIVQLKQAVEQGMGEGDPSVRAWSGYVTTLLADDARRPQLATRLAASRDPIQRLLIAAAVDALPAESRTQVLNQLAEDSDPVVRQYAQATQAVIARRDATGEPGANAAPTTPGN